MGEQKRKTDFLAKNGLPEGFNLDQDMCFISDDGNGPVALSYLIYAHNRGVTLRDLAAAVVAVVAMQMTALMESDDPDDRAAYAKIQSELTKIKDETDGGLVLDDRYGGLVEMIDEWGDYDILIDSHPTLIKALVAYHLAGETLLGIVDKICHSDGKPNDSEVLFEATLYEDRPNGKMDALAHFFETGEDLENEDDEDGDDDDD